ncbi:MAG: hypothetical protein N5P05_001732 [Chroococcopsis gigantea SAG 12.99]|jgi:hypothetical protein|nr:hypothetical protein [Chlorogloea purpurea SAG 13.99]MDV3000126.1 hypothetical protein [Chroococcopsis gigantea SAG 12.99]
MTFDPRTISTPVFTVLQELYTTTKNQETLKEHKNQAIELYTYLSTWGMLRLKAEETALSQKGKKQVVEKYFKCLEKLSERKDIANQQGLNTLKNLSVDDYLGLTGLGLEIAQEFSFWANAIYDDVKGDN